MGDTPRGAKFAFDTHVDGLRAKDAARHLASRSSIKAEQFKLTQKLAGIDRQEADQSDETPDEVVARHAKRKINDGLKYARKHLTGKMRKAFAQTASPAGCILVQVQDLWRSKKKPNGGVMISSIQLSSWLAVGGWGASKPSLRNALEMCVSKGVLTVRKSGRRPRFYLPIVPAGIYRGDDYDDPED